MEVDSDYLNCRTCRVRFSETVTHREHFKSEWHLYNIKRKVIKLAPISVEEFVERQLLSQGGSCVSSELGETDWYCAYCSRRFQSKRAWLNHQESQKHKQKEKQYVDRGMKRIKVLTEEAQARGMPAPSRDEMNEILRPPLRQKKSTGKPWGHGDAPRNKWLQEIGMLETFSDDDELIEEDEEEEDDWEEVLEVQSLASEVAEAEQRVIPLEECVFCGFVSKSWEDNLRHMAQKHDFRIPDLAFVKDPKELMRYLFDKVGLGNMCLVCGLNGKAFFSLKAVRMHMLEKGHCRISTEGVNALELIDFYDFTKADDQPELLREGLSEEEPLQAEDQGFEMVLPSGAVLGHRQLKRYFAQKHSEIRHKPRDIAPPKFKAIGYGENEDSHQALVAKDLRHVWKLTAKNRIKSELQHNKVSRKHFRDPTGLLQ